MPMKGRCACLHYMEIQCRCSPRLTAVHYIPYNCGRSKIVLKLLGVNDTKQGKGKMNKKKRENEETKNNRRSGKFGKMIEEKGKKGKGKKGNEKEKKERRKKGRRKTEKYILDDEGDKEKCYIPVLLGPCTK